MFNVQRKHQCVKKAMDTHETQIILSTLFFLDLDLISYRLQ